jgi:hypothetical protein
MPRMVPPLHNADLALPSTQSSPDEGVVPMRGRAVVVRPSRSLLPKEPVVVDFDQAAKTSMLQLRRSTAEVINQLGDLDRPVRLAERLRIDRSLAWKVWKVAFDPSPLPSAAHIPGASAYQRFIAAAEGAGVSREVAGGALAAFEQLSDVLTAHGGDRASGTIMLTSLSDAGRMRAELSLRRAAFRANSHFLGVQAVTLYQLDVLVPAGPGHRPSLLRLRAHLGLKRTRAEVSWMLGRSTPVASDGPLAGAQREPLVQTPEGDSPWLLRDFCSQPLPEVRRRVIGGVTVEDELVPGAVGMRGVVDVVMGERITSIPWRDGPRHAVVMKINTPCEQAVYEVVAAEGVLEGPPTLRAHSMVHGELPYLRGEHCDVIPVPEQFADCGTPGQSGPLADLPMHLPMLNWMVQRSGVAPERLRMWRAHVKFPPVPACLAAVMLQRTPGEQSRTGHRP